MSRVYVVELSAEAMDRNGERGEKEKEEGGSRVRLELSADAVGGEIKMWDPWSSLPLSNLVRPSKINGFVPMEWIYYW